MSVAAVVATVVAGGVIRSSVPDVNRREQPFIRAGAMGQPLPARTFEATVLDIRGGAKIDFRERVHDTGGVWLVARARLVARGAAMDVSYAALVDNEGRRFVATERFFQSVPNGAHTLQPGIPVVVEIAFEVPAGVPTPLHVRFADRSLDLRMDAIAQCRLPVDGATLRGWQAQTQPLTVAAPEVEA